MSNCIKELYDYDLIKKCPKCGIISLKSNFHKRMLSIDGLDPRCKFCEKALYLDKRDRLLNKQNFYSKENSDRIKQYNKQKCDQLNDYHKKYNKQNRSRTNIYEKNRKKTDLNCKLACNLRSRTSSAFESQNVRKTNKTLDLLGCSHSIFQRWIIHQSYGNMNVENYGKIWCLDHCLAVESFNLLDENDMKKCFNWINLKPMYVKESFIKGDKIDHRLYLLQQVKAKYFSKLSEEGYNENFH